MSGTERIAVVIPVRDERENIVRRLAELKAHGCSEIVVVAGGSTDGTPEIVRQYRHVTLVETAACRGLQINAGVAATTAPIVVVLHADTTLPESADALIRRSLSDPRVVAGCFRLSFDFHTSLLDLYAFSSRFETRYTTFGDQAFFFRRQAFLDIDGAPEWPLLEDVELRRRLLRRGQFVKIQVPVRTSARRFERLGSLRAQVLNATILVAYELGVSPHRLARVYRKGGWLPEKSAPTKNARRSRAKG